MIYDCIIIGSGVAGLTAGLYLKRANKSVLIIEDSVIGGTTATLECVENYPGFAKISGMDLIQNMVAQVSLLGVSINIMSINRIDFDNKRIITSSCTLYYKTLIIASGMSYNKLDIEDEDKFKYKGLSYCAVCDGPLYRDKKVAVVTNGNSGLESINHLFNITKDITVIDCIDKYKNDTCTVYSNSNITKIIGDNVVSGVEIECNGVKKIIDCNGIFVALGKSINTKLFDKKLDIKDGFIDSDENMHTNIDGVFVAGDIRKKSLRQIITACADGAIAGTEAIKFIQKI